MNKEIKISTRPIAIDKEIKIAKANLYRLLLKAQAGFVTENEIDIMLCLVKDDQIQEILEASKTNK